MRVKSFWSKNLMKAYKTTQGNWQVNFSEFGKQRTLYLGREFTVSSADRVARIVTEILSCRKMGDAVSPEIIRRISELPVNIQKSFVKHGLMDKTSCRTLGELLAVDGKNWTGE